MGGGGHTDAHTGIHFKHDAHEDDQHQLGEKNPANVEQIFSGEKVELCREQFMAHAHTHSHH